jgi:hypothetical protein
MRPLSTVAVHRTELREDVLTPGPPGCGYHQKGFQDHHTGTPDFVEEPAVVVVYSRSVSIIDTTTIEEDTAYR